MPSRVKWFERLAFAAFGFGLLMTGVLAVALAMQPNFKNFSPLVFGFGARTFIFAMTLLFAWLAARRRRNWARWLFTIVVLGELVLELGVIKPMEDLGISPLFGGLAVIQIFLNLSAIIFAFTGNARSYFRKLAPASMEQESGLPSNAARFEKLAYGSLVLGIPIAALQWPRLKATPGFEQVGGIGFVVIVGVLTLAVLVLLIWQAARRRKNWARWLFAILFVIGLVPSFPRLIEALGNRPLAGGLMVVQWLLQLAALFFIFSGNARLYFKKAPVVA